MELVNPNVFNRENGCISRLAPLLHLEDSDIWILTEDKSEVLGSVLDILSVLVTACNPQDAYATQVAHPLVFPCYSLQIYKDFI